MSIRNRVKRLEQLCKKPASDDVRAGRWLAEHHPDVLERYSILLQQTGNKTDAALRNLTDADLNILVEAFAVVTGRR